MYPWTVTCTSYPTKTSDTLIAINWYGQTAKELIFGFVKSYSSRNTIKVVFDSDINYSFDRYLPLTKKRKNI